MAVPPVANPSVVQAQSGIASKLDKKVGKTSFLHHLRVVSEPAENSTSLGKETPSRPRSELKVGVFFMPTFFRFYPVNRGVFAFSPPCPRSLFLRRPRTAGLWNSSQKRLLGPISLFLRFSAGSG
jgi:hypothetical protein